MQLHLDCQHLILSFLPLTQIQLWANQRKQYFTDRFWKFYLLHRYSLKPEQMLSWIDGPVAGGWLSLKLAVVKIAGYMGEIGYNAHLFLPISLCFHGAVRQNDLELFTYFLDRSHDPNAIRYAIEYNNDKFLAIALAKIGKIELGGMYPKNNDKVNTILRKFLQNKTIETRIEAWYAGFLGLPLTLEVNDDSWYGGYYYSKNGQQIERLKPNDLNIEAAVSSGCYLLDLTINEIQYYLKQCFLMVRPDQIKEIIAKYPDQFNTFCLQNKDKVFLLYRNSVEFIDHKIIPRAQELLELILHKRATLLESDGFEFTIVVLEIICNSINPEHIRMCKNKLLNNRFFTALPNDDILKLLAGYAVVFCNTDYLHNYLHKNISNYTHKVGTNYSNLFHDPLGAGKLIQYKYSNIHIQLWQQGKLVEFLATHGIIKDDSSKYDVYTENNMFNFYPGEPIEDVVAYVQDNCISNDKKLQHNILEAPDSANALASFSLLLFGSTWIKGPPFCEPMIIDHKIKPDTIYITSLPYPEVALFAQAKGISISMVPKEIKSLAVYDLLLSLGVITKNKSLRKQLLTQAEKEKQILAQLLS